MWKNIHSDDPNLRALKRLNDAMRWKASFKSGIDLGAVGAASGLAIIILSKFVLLDIPLLEIAALLPVGTFLIGLAYGLFRGIPPSHTAQCVDEAVKCKQAVFTWCETSSSGVDTPFEGLLRERASAALDGLPASKVCGFIRLKWSMLRLLSLGALCLGVFFIPQISRISLTTAMLPAEIVKPNGPELAAKVEKASSTVKKLGLSAENDPVRKAAEEMDAMFEAMKKDGMEKKKFDAKFTAMTEGLNKKLDPFTGDKNGLDKFDSKFDKMNDSLSMKDSLKGLQDAASDGAVSEDDKKAIEELENALSEGDFEKAEELMSDMLNSGEEASGRSEKLNKAMKELSEKMKALKKFDQKDIDAIKKLCKELRGVSDELDPSGELTKMIEDLEECLDEGDKGKCSRSLKKLSEKLGKLAKGRKLTEGQLAELDELMDAMGVLAECDSAGSSSKRLAMLKAKQKSMMNASSFAGGGDTNEDDGYGGEAVMGIPHVEGGPDANAAKEFEQLYSPESIDGEFQGTKVSGGIRPESGGPVVIRSFKGTPGKPSESRVDLKDIPQSYIEDAQRSFSEEEIPPEYRELIKKYFGAFK